jgi:hypothetical protein
MARDWSSDVCSSDLPSPRFQASEANAVVDNFNRLSERQKQDLLNFLRSL